MHPLVEAAGREGKLPEWAVCSERRRDHVGRVRDLIGEWAAELDVAETERVRWKAAAVLHDALRDAPPETLRDEVEGDWPDPVLHAPACAERLRGKGVEDEELLHAITYHPLGHPAFGDLGGYLYLADFLDPGRGFLTGARKRLRAIVPTETDEALRSVIALRLARRLEVRGTIRSETVTWWNELVGT